jgi:very-short-patch-repair endonuclease
MAAEGDAEDLNEADHPSAESDGAQSGSPSFLDALRRQITSALVDQGRNNPFLFFRPTQTTRFLTPPIGTPFVNALLNGDVVRRSLFETYGGGESGGSSAALESVQAAEPKQPQQRATRIQVPLDPLMRKLRAIQARAKEFDEERGIQTLYFAVGMATWKAEDGGRDAKAPVVLVPIRVVNDPMVRGDLALRRADEGEPILNHSLATSAPEVARGAIAELFTEGIDDPLAAVSALRERLVGISSVEVTDETAIGIFNFAYLAMIEDLNASQELLEEHTLVRALAGDLEAQEALRQGIDDTKLVDVHELDAIAPADEPFVLDADPWQARAIHTVVRGEGNVVIDGPPGTGKSQTIANLIATLLQRGKTVLFVAEKRAALDVVYKRLESVDLAHLVLDLHGRNVTRKKAFTQLSRAHRRLSQATPVDADIDTELMATRDRLNRHRKLVHTPTPASGLTPFELLSRRAALRLDGLSVRLSPAELDVLPFSTIAEHRRALEDVATSPDLFLRTPTVPWACCSVPADDLPDAIERLRSAAQVLEYVHATLVELQIVAETREIFEKRAAALRALAGALAVVRPSIVDIQPDTLDAAIAATASPLSAVLSALSGSGRRAMREVRKQLVGTYHRSDVHRALLVLRQLDPDLVRATRTIATKDAARLASTSVSDAWDAAEAILGGTLPDNVPAALTWLRRHLDDRTTAYRSAHVHSVERSIRDGGFETFVTALVDARLEASSWSPALEAVWLDSHLETLRARFAAFNGRLHEREIHHFAILEERQRSINARRVERAVAANRVRIANEHKAQTNTITAEIERTRSRKSLRDLTTAAPQAFLSLAPCVMASPLSVSQYLPRQRVFDVVIFDEASQVTPAVAIASIVRGARLVVAGDDRQLPPTNFFGQLADVEEGEDEDETVGGYESILTAVRAYSTRMRLQVHYRSLDEHLIAFSNKWIYDNELITFPGAFDDDYGVRAEVVAPTLDDIDADSATSEVEQVVDLVLEHAEKRPDESLGVIALGIKHAQRVQMALDAALRDRPDLDDFFKEEQAERAPFFVKNLERVQGDERDAIILTLGYGRTRGGTVSHNFGPVNKPGGERRLNVAVTRAKTRLTAVSSFAESDLDATKLANSRGASLLGKYLGYCATRGRDLGDRGGADVPLNAFEQEIADVLTEQLELNIVPQYGVGGYRIDLAVRHPDIPGRFVLAIECDGAGYHSTPTARMRDRMRQRLLEDRGWRFCRIWSTDWFNDPKGEVARVWTAYQEALAGRAFAEDVQTIAAPPVQRISEPAGRAGPKPRIRPYSSIADLSDYDLQQLLTWIAGDGRLRTNDELFEELFGELGFSRRGGRIASRLTDAVNRFARKTK